MEGRQYAMQISAFVSHEALKTTRKLSYFLKELTLNRERAIIGPFKELEASYYKWLLPEI